MKIVGADLEPSAVVRSDLDLDLDLNYRDVPALPDLDTFRMLAHPADKYHSLLSSFSFLPA